MIREANKFDLDACVEMMRQYAAESGIPALSNEAAHDEAHVSQLLTSLMSGRGFVLIDTKGRGMLAAIITRNFWCPSVLELREAAWWVAPEYRDRMIGGKLFAAFRVRAGELIRAGRVHAVFASLLEQSAVQSLPNFRRIDSTFMMKV